MLFIFIFVSLIFDVVWLKQLSFGPTPSLFRYYFIVASADATGVNVFVVLVDDADVHYVVENVVYLYVILGWSTSGLVSFNIQNMVTASGLFPVYRLNCVANAVQTVAFLYTFTIINSIVCVLFLLFVSCVCYVTMYYYCL